jgi:hypothetical protein
MESPPTINIIEEPVSQENKKQPRLRDGFSFTGNTKNGVSVIRDGRVKMKADKQLKLYSPCSCGSGKKFKFCCNGKEMVVINTDEALAYN